MATSNNDIERIHALETDVAILSRDSDLHTRTLEKIDFALDKIGMHVEAVSRAQNVLDEKFRSQEKINRTLEDSIIALELKLNTQEESRIEFLRSLKEDIIQRIDAVKPHIDNIHKDHDIKTGFKIFKFFVDNWKFLLVIVAMIMGLVFNKWHLFSSLLGN